MSGDDRMITGPHGPVPVRIYPPARTSAAGPTSAAAAGAAPGLVWLHGGGFAYGDLDMPEGDWVADQLAARGIGVVSVDYRLAPRPTAAGFTFPVPADDVLAAFHWTLAHAAELGLDPGALSIGGASAGGALAAAAAVRLRDAGGPAPRRVLLAYPTVHAVLPDPSEELAAKILLLPEQDIFTPAEVAEMNLNYVGDPAELANPHAFPGGHDLSALPPTLIINSDLDSLRSSGEAYAEELRAAGVDVTCLSEPGTVHGHLDRPDQPGATVSLERMATWLLSDRPDIAGTPPDVPATLKDAS